VGFPPTAALPFALHSAFLVFCSSLLRLCSAFFLLLSGCLSVLALVLTHHPPVPFSLPFFVSPCLVGRLSRACRLTSFVFSQLVPCCFFAGAVLCFAFWLFVARFLLAIGGIPRSRRGNTPPLLLRLVGRLQLTACNLHQAVLCFAFLVLSWCCCCCCSRSCSCRVAVDGRRLTAGNCRPPLSKKERTRQERLGQEPRRGYTRNNNDTKKAKDPTREGAIRETTTTPRRQGTSRLGLGGSKGVAKQKMRSSKARSPEGIEENAKLRSA
jgi:hypothetical protein